MSVKEAFFLIRSANSFESNLTSEWEAVGSAQTGRGVPTGVGDCRLGVVLAQTEGGRGANEGWGMGPTGVGAQPSWENTSQPE